MKKLLAFLVSLVLALTLVAAVACGGNQPGGNNFTTVDLTNTDARAEFVNTLAEKADLEKLFGDPTKAGWTYGLEETASSNVEFNVSATAEGTTLTANGKVELSENAKVTIKSNGEDKDPDLAASMKLSAKGNVTLPQDLYDVLTSLNEELDFGALAKSLLTNFNYSVDAYVDNDVALISISDSLYNKLPDIVKDSISQKIKISLKAANDVAAYAAETDGAEDMENEIIKQSIDAVVDYLVSFKIGVAVSNQNGYALKLTVTKESVVALLSALPSVEEVTESDFLALINSVAGSLSDSSKIELTVRIDSNGAFNSFKVESNLAFNLDLTIGEVKLSGTASLKGSVEVKKFTGKVSKPNEKDYKELEGFQGGDIEFDD